MAHDIGKVVKQVVAVASAVASAKNPVSSGTVISVNPDGSLNVDDGQGGCVRQAPRQAAKPGDRVTLGTEPALGTVTSLPQLNLTVPPSTAACPTDPRIVPVPLTPINALTIRYGVNNARFPSWSDRGTDYGTHTAPAASTAIEVGLRAYAQFRSDGAYVIRRGFVSFPTDNLVPKGSVLVAASMLFSVSPGSIGGTTGTDTYSYGGNSVIVVPSVAPDFTLTDPPTSLVTDAIVQFGDDSSELGRFSLPEVLAGSTLYEIPLTVEGLLPYFNIGGHTKLAIVSEPDFLGAPPSQDVGSTFHGDNISIGDITYPRPYLILTYLAPI